MIYNLPGLAVSLDNMFIRCKGAEDHLHNLKQLFYPKTVYIIKKINKSFFNPKRSASVTFPPNMDFQKIKKSVCA